MIGIKYFTLLNLFKKVIGSVLKHLFAIFCLKYLVPTISVISVTDLWSVIRIYKKKEYWNTVLQSFDTCRARQLFNSAGLDSAQNSSTIPQNRDFWRKLPLFNVISERYRTRLIYTIFDIFWQWCKNNVDPKYVSLKTAPGITIWQSYGKMQVWSVISVTVTSVTFPSISYVIYMEKYYIR